jgi:hypothetical protein
MKVPNGQFAFIDMAKLRDYSLSPQHPEGKHKARVFQAALGLGLDDAEWLRDELLKAVANLPCTPGRLTVYGQRYILDFRAERHGKSALLRSIWIVRRGEESPRLVSCYVL